MDNFAEVGRPGQLGRWQDLLVGLHDALHALKSWIRWVPIQGEAMADTGFSISLSDSAEAKCWEHP